MIPIGLFAIICLPSLFPLRLLWFLFPLLSKLNVKPLEVYIRGLTEGTGRYVRLPPTLPLRSGNPSDLTAGVPPIAPSAVAATPPLCFASAVGRQCGGL